jgi:transposase-like protein
MSTNTDQTAGVIIKSDHCGRARYTSQYKQEVVAAFQSSSLSAPAFARQCGIKYSTLAAWVAARRCGKAKTSRRSTPAFLLAELAEQTATPVLEVQLPGGALARVSHPEQIRLLATLVRQLA